MAKTAIAKKFSAWLGKISTLEMCEFNPPHRSYVPQQRRLYAYCKAQDSRSSQIIIYTHAFVLDFTKLRHGLSNPLSSTSASISSWIDGQTTSVLSAPPHQLRNINIKFHPVPAPSSDGRGTMFQVFLCAQSAAVASHSTISRSALQTYEILHLPINSKMPLKTFFCANSPQ